MKVLMGLVAKPHQAPSLTLQIRWSGGRNPNLLPTSHDLALFFLGPPVHRIMLPAFATALLGFFPLAPPVDDPVLLPSLFFFHPVVEKLQIQHLASLLVWARGVCC